MKKSVGARASSPQKLVRSTNLAGKDARAPSSANQSTTVLLLLFLTLLFLEIPAQAQEFGINFHGFSYHPDRTDSAGNHFRGFNPGIGARFVFRESARHVWLVEGGIYSNSSGNASKYAGGGYRFKLPAGFEVGPTLALYQSPDQNNSRTFLAPLLVLSYRYKKALFHIVPVPRYKDVNRNAVVGFYATVNLWKGAP